MSMDPTHEEILQYIQENYGKQTRKELASSLNVSVYQIRKAVKELIAAGKITPLVDTTSRKSPEKEQFVIDNYEKMSRDEIAKDLGESPRWVKRTIKELKDAGRIEAKRILPEQILSESDWTLEMRSRAVELRRILRKTNKEAADILNEEYGLSLTPAAYQFWITQKLNSPYQFIQDWLKENIPPYQLQTMIDHGMRMVDIASEVKENFGISVTDDQILIYAQSEGIKSQRLHQIDVVNQRANSFSKEWLQDQVNSHVGLKGISEKMGVSSTLVQKRLHKEGIELISHRIKWSKSLEDLRSSLLEVEPLCVSEEDLHQMILGWIFGDGHLDSHGRFVVNHSLIQLDYLYLKARVLKGFLTNVVTVPRQSFSGEGLCIGSKEQLGISCPGLDHYVEYLNSDGSKNFMKIAQELNGLGWGCVFMDDGSFFSGEKVLIAKHSICESLKNRFIFGDIIQKKLIRVNQIDPEYIIPGMADKLGSEDIVGGYWEDKVPELFNPTIESDLSLSFLNGHLCDQNPSLLHQAVRYYHQRGFPFFSISDEYLEKEYHKLCVLNTQYLEKEDGSIRFIDVGNNIFRHFMQHMVEAKYKSVSPRETFESVAGLFKVLQYAIHQKRDCSVLPVYLLRNLMRFNGGVTGFPCGVAKAIVYHFSNPGDVVVDPCAGWGGRMLGTVSAGRKYVGYEPWKASSLKLQEMLGYFGLDAEIYGEAFHSTRPCHLMFTSPPFLDLEVYGHSYSQEDWDGLMRNIFQEAEMKLFSGGHLVLDLPNELVPLLPPTGLKSLSSLMWHNSPRSKKPSSILHIWRKS